MKINGIDLKAKPYDEAVFEVLGQEVTFRAQVVTDYSVFERLVPEPKPFMTTTANGKKEYNTDHPKYKEALDSYSEKNMVFMVMESLKVTEGLEWDILDLNQPETLTVNNLTKEFTNAGFPTATASKIINLATAANGLTKRLVDTARDSFLPEAQEPEQEASSE